jgi:uncharacterized protein involved in exopolysaccharide biosynthesis
VAEDSLHVTPELIGILSVGGALLVGLGSLQLTLYRGLRADLAASRAETQADLAAVQTEVRADLKESRAENRAGLAAVQIEIRADLKASRAENRADLAAVQTEVRADLKALDARVGSLEQQVARLTGAVEVLAGLGNGRQPPRPREPEHAG